MCCTVQLLLLDARGRHLPVIATGRSGTAFEQDIDHVFDVTQVRRSLYQQKVDLELELRRVRQSLLTINYIGKYGVVY